MEEESHGQALNSVRGATASSCIVTCDLKLQDFLCLGIVSMATYLIIRQIIVFNRHIYLFTFESGHNLKTPKFILIENTKAKLKSCLNLKLHKKLFFILYSSVSSSHNI